MRCNWMNLKLKSKCFMFILKSVVTFKCNALLIQFKVIIRKSKMKFISVMHFVQSLYSGFFSFILHFMKTPRDYSSFYFFLKSMQSTFLLSRFLLFFFLSFIKFLHSYEQTYFVYEFKLSNASECDKAIIPADLMISCGFSIKCKATRI